MAGAHAGTVTLRLQELSSDTEEKKELYNTGPWGLAGHGNVKSLN